MYSMQKQLNAARGKYENTLHANTCVHVREKDGKFVCMYGWIGGEICHLAVRCSNSNNGTEI